MTFIAARAAADPVMSVRDAVASVEQGDLDDVEVPVYDATEVGLLQAGFNRMVEGLRERQRIREAFGVYVDHEVAEHILEEGVSLEGEEVEVTLLFLDVRDFTSWAEGVSASEVVERLNGLFDVVVPIIHEHKGHVDKFVGDGLLAVFGAPQRSEDHADQALRTALEIVKAVEDLELEIGIGLNSGTVVAGNVGGGGRLEFSVVGDAVNVASRIEAATRETGDPILLSEDTAERLSDSGELQVRDDIELKGKSEPVRLLAPDCSRGRTRPPCRLAGRYATANRHGGQAILADSPDASGGLSLAGSCWPPAVGGTRSSGGCARASLLREHPGVYRVGHRAPTTEATYLAAVLACGEGSALSGRPAGWLERLLKGLPPPPEVTSPRRRNIPGLSTRCCRSLAPQDVMTYRGIPVTTVPRTLLDLAAILSEEELARACHEAGVLHCTTPRARGRRAGPPPQRQRRRQAEKRPLRPHHRSPSASWRSASSTCCETTVSRYRSPTRSRAKGAWTAAGPSTG